MQAKWPRSITSRILLLVFIASLVPASLLLGGGLYLNARVQEQMQREVDDALSLAINLEQTLIDGSLTRMRERAVTLAAHPDVVEALRIGGDPQPVLDQFMQALPGADLITVVGPDARVLARAGSAARGDTVGYGGLVQQVLSALTPSSSAVLITPAELAGESARVHAQVKVAVLETPGSSDQRGGQTIEEALALVGAAPVLGQDGQVHGAVLVSDILNNDHAIVDEVTNRAPPGLTVNASIALDGVRITTTVPDVGGGRRAVGTLYSDAVMEKLRVGQEYRGRALVGGWQWQRTIYLPLRDPSGRVIAGPYVGIPDVAFSRLAQSSSSTTAIAVAMALLSLAVAAAVAYRLSATGIAEPLKRLTELLTRGEAPQRLVEEGPAEIAALTEALNRTTERIRQTLSGMAQVSHGIHAVSDELAARVKETSANVDLTREVGASTLQAAELAGGSAQQAAGQMRELEVALARINAGSEEQTRTLRHAGQIIALVTQAVQESRSSIEAVLEAIRAVVAAAQQGRHGALRSISTLELIRMDVEPAEPSEGGARTERLLADLELAQCAVTDCDNALEQIVRRTEEATERLWALAAVMNEGGARAGAVSQQVADLSGVAEETGERLRSTSDATRQVIHAVEEMAGAIEAGLQLVRRAEAHVATIAEANRQVQALTERIRSLAAQLDKAAMDLK